MVAGHYLKDLEGCPKTVLARGVEPFEWRTCCGLTFRFRELWLAHRRIKHLEKESIQ